MLLWERVMSSSSPCPPQVIQECYRKDENTQTSLPPRLWFPWPLMVSLRYGVTTVRSWRTGTHMPFLPTNLSQAPEWVFPLVPLPTFQQTLEIAHLGHGGVQARICCPGNISPASFQGLNANNQEGWGRCQVPKALWSRAQGRTPEHGARELPQAWPWEVW